MILRSAEQLKASKEETAAVQAKLGELERELQSIRQLQSNGESDTVRGLKGKLMEVMQQLERCEIVQSQRIEDLSGQLKQVTEQKVNLESQLQESAALAAQADSEHQNHLEQSQQLVDSLREQLNAVTSEKTSIEQRCVLHNLVHNSKSLWNYRLTAELESAKEELLQTVTELNESKDTMNQSFEEFNQESDEYQEEIKRLKAQWQEAKEQWAVREQLLQQQLEQAQDDLRVLKAVHDSEQAAAQEKKVAQLQSLYQKALADLKESRDAKTEATAT